MATVARKPRLPSTLPRFVAIERRSIAAAVFEVVCWGRSERPFQILSILCIHVPFPIPNSLLSLPLPLCAFVPLCLCAFLLPIPNWRADAAPTASGVRHAG